VRFPPPELLVKVRDAEIQANKLRREHENAKELQKQVCVEGDPKEPGDPAEPFEPEKVLQDLQALVTAPSTESPQISYQQRVDTLLHEYRHARAIQELHLRHR